MLCLVIKSFTLAMMVKFFHSCRDDGLRPSDCRVNSRHVLGDVLHLVRLPENLRGDDPHLVGLLVFLSTIRVVLALS